MARSGGNGLLLFFGGLTCLCQLFQHRWLLHPEDPLSCAPDVRPASLSFRSAVIVQSFAEEVANVSGQRRRPNSAMICKADAPWGARGRLNFLGLPCPTLIYSVSRCHRWRFPLVPPTCCSLGSMRLSHSGGQKENGCAQLCNERAFSVRSPLTMLKPSAKCSEVVTRKLYRAR